MALEQGHESLDPVEHCLRSGRFYPGGHFIEFSSSWPQQNANTRLLDTAHNTIIDLDRHEVVVRTTLRSARVAPCPLETRAAAARWEPDGRLTHWSSCQGAHPNRALLCNVYGLPQDMVRVIAPDVGGSFGAKARAYPEEVLLAFLARRVGRPVRWVPDRSTDMVGLGHARAQVQHLTVAGRRDGTIEVRSGCEAGSDAGHRRLRAAGFTHRRTFWEMVGPVTEEARTAPPVPWLTIKGVEDTRTFHAMLMKGFEDHWGFFWVPHDEWLSAERSFSGYDPALWFLAEIEDAYEALES